MGNNDLYGYELHSSPPMPPGYHLPERRSSRQTVAGVVEAEGVNILHKPRAGDSDRERVTSHLSQCHALGYIDNDEFHARLEDVANCDTKDKTLALMADLPPLTMPQPKFRVAFPREKGSVSRNIAWFLAIMFSVTFAVLGSVFSYAMDHVNGPGLAGSLGISASILLGFTGLVVSAIFLCVENEND